MPDSYLAFDLGAETGRLILGTLVQGRLELTEIHRFPNRMVNLDGHLRWDVNGLFKEMKQGLALCAQKYTSTPASIGIDTWGVDFGLLDDTGNLLELPVTYRDHRTEGAIEGFLSLMPREKLYGLTGIQIVPINSLFQLYALKRDQSRLMGRTHDLLFMPDLFNYFLTGAKQTEFTFATTSQLLNPLKHDWEPEIFDALGIPLSIMPGIVPPGADVGLLSEAVCRETGMSRVPVKAVASHDTASAVAAVPAADPDFVYISSGTWSLMGIESDRPLINPKTLKYNFTNEGGIAGKFLVLKNISGLWLMQECRRVWLQTYDYSYDELARLATEAQPFRSLIDPDAPDFRAPENMPGAIADYCQRTRQPVPNDTGEFGRCIFDSLVLAYRCTLEQIRDIRDGALAKAIHIIGGGSENRLVRQMTADATGVPVLAGPREATAIGNILVQAMADGKVSGLAQLREIVRNSFEIAVYEPARDDRWTEEYERFLELRSPG